MFIVLYLELLCREHYRVFVAKRSYDFMLKFTSSLRFDEPNVKM